MDQNNALPHPDEDVQPVTPVYTPEMLVDRLAEIKNILMQEGVGVGNLGQPLQNRVATAVQEAITLIREGHQ